MCRARTLCLVPVALVLSTVVAGCTSAEPVESPQNQLPGGYLGPLALGVNVAAWDSTLAGADVTAVDDRIKAAGLHLLRYPGGSWADEYDWATNTDTSKCVGVAGGTCSASDALGFDALSAQARTAGASMFVTINYGSGTPAEAAAWVTHSAKSVGRSVALWEVGNESYSCLETNRHLAGSPTFVVGFTPGGPVCPATEVMAESYATNVVPYLNAMKQAGPGIRIGVPWAFSGTEARGSGVVDAAGWNRTVLRSVHGDINFVDAHWYPFDTTNAVTDQQILASIRTIPSAATRIRSTLHRYAPGAAFVVGETNVSERPTTIDFRPVSALFAAGASLEWLAYGAESVDWWNLNNFGSPATGDYGLLSSGAPEAEPAGTPFPPYYGEELASRLTSAGSHLVTLESRSPTLIGFQSDLRGTRRVLLINTDPTRPAQVGPRWFAKGPELHVETYSASSASAASPIVESTAPPGRPVTLPAQSIMVLSGVPAGP